MSDQGTEVAGSPWPQVADGEDSVTYAVRLEGEGYGEMFIRKSLRTRFGLSLKDFSNFFQDNGLARMRHVKLIICMSRRRTEYSLMRKVAKDLGISDQRATTVIEQIRVAGDRPELKSREFP